MTYKGIFNIAGNATQQKIITDALDKIMFPWDKLTAPRGTFNIAWADLNSTQLVGKLHQGHKGEPEKIEGVIDGRRYVMGVFYPNSGNIYIDSYLVYYPHYAQETVSAEIAHLVDFFLPITDVMKRKIWVLMHNGNEAPHGHTDWWEHTNYGTEYYDLVGESFMQAFTLAYSDMEFSGSASFTHTITKEQAPEIRKILGIERTDHKAELKEYLHFDGSEVYHRLSHYTREDEDSKVITDTTGLRPCKVCKPE